MRRLALIVLALAGLAGCAEVNFEDARPGEFEGAVSVYWLEQSTSASGSGGRFVYVPVPGFELRFIRPEGSVPAAIAPGVMYTDGGSIPRVAQAFRGFPRGAMARSISCMTGFLPRGAAWRTRARRQNSSRPATWHFRRRWTSSSRR